MRHLILQIAVIASSFPLFANAADSGIKKFAGRLPSGLICQLMYTTQGSAGDKITAIQFDLGDKKFELTGSSLSSSQLNSSEGLFQGAGILNRKVVITSEVLGVGYETGINVDFQIKLNAQARPAQFTVSLQNYRNEYVFGSWVQGERGEAQIFVCQ